MSASSSNSLSKSKSTTCGSSHKGKDSEEEVDIQRKRPSTASRPQPVESKMPASASKPPLKSIIRGSSLKGKISEEVGIQRKRPSPSSASTASQLQPVESSMSASASKRPLTSITRGSTHKGKEVNIERKGPSTASRPQPVESNMSASASKPPLTSITRGSIHKGKEVDIEQKGPFTASRLQSVESSMSASASKSPLKSITRGSTHKGKEVDIERKGPSTASRLQSFESNMSASVSKRPLTSIARGSTHKGKDVDIERKGPSTASRLQSFESNMSASASKRPLTSITRGSTHKEVDIERKGPFTTSRLQSVKSSIPASASRSPSKSITRGCSKKPEKQVDIQRKIPSTASRLQPVDRVTEDVRDAQSKKATDGSDPGTSIISTLPPPVPPIIPEVSSVNRDSQSRETGGTVDPGFPIQIETQTVATETRSITLFQESSNLQISNTKFTTIGGDATIFQFGDGQFTEAHRDLICDHIATLAALPDIKDNLKKHALTHLIILLPRAEAVFNDYQTKKKSGPCFDGTRVALLREMANWVTSQDESRMYILSGLAGIGKSTVAYTIASRAANPKLNLLGASFFFSRDEPDRNNAKKLFTTIAYQFCVYNETFAKAIGDVLLTERGSAATTKDPQEQLQVLILDPLRSIVQSRDRPILVVVDALDECDEDDISVVVEGLSQLVRDLPSFKVILTTRPLPYLDDFLGNHHKLFHLQDIEDKIVDGDIGLYLKHNLSLEMVRKCFRRRQWCASDEQIDALVRAAGRLFIIASTTVRYILDKSAANPAAQMQELLRACAEEHTPFTDLDHFYNIILRNVVPANCASQNIVSRYQSVVGAIIFVSRPLPVSTLAHLIDMDAEEIYVVLDNLQSVILLGDNDVPRIYHKSFPDYLTDQARCKDPCLRIVPKIGHTQIATRCFKITNEHLMYNILGLGDPTRFMSNENGLKKDGITDLQLQEKIPQHLRYSCVYWVNHFEVADIEDTGLMNGLETFVDEHTLHWFEVLSLIGNLDLAHRAIRAVIKLLKSTSSDLHQLLSEALRFISKSYAVIKQSALHTYYSALPFTPTDSLLYRRYIEEARHNICVIEGGPEKWDAVVAILSHGEMVDAIKFSLDSTLFVSCSEETEDNQGKLKIWDAATGTPISTIPGRRFAFTNDFSTIASSSDNIIMYYNANGSARGMFTTPSKIHKLALSEESSRVAAALSDGTVLLWDSRNAELICSFDGFKSSEWPWLEFSRTGTRLAYSSAIGFNLRDGISGRFIADLKRGSSQRLFSADGSRIAALSRDCGLALWNTESGELVVLARNDYDSVLAISANGSLLATADYKNVTLWSENRKRLAEFDSEVLELRDTRSMAFLVDNILAIGTCDGTMLYNMNTHSFISTLSYTSPTALAFSPDCTQLAVASKEGDMYLWDILRGIDTSGSPSQKATLPIYTMALSRDCSRLACGFVDGTVELWETSPTKRRIASHQCDDRVSVVEFGPDGRLFASGLDDGTIKLWNAGDGSLHGTLIASTSGWLRALALSGSVLVAAGRDVTLWSLATLSLIHTFELGPRHGGRSLVTISDDSDLVALGVQSIHNASVHLVDVMNRTTIATFTVSSAIYKLTFLPNKSQLVAQTHNGDFQSLNLINNCITNGPTLEHLIQLPDTPLWHGVPVWLCWAPRQCYVAALFSQHQTPVPVLQIPSNIVVNAWTQGSSMIALYCEDGRIILLRLPTSHLG